MTDGVSCRPRVLIIDDSVELIELLRFKFKADHDLYSSLSGEDGLRMVEKVKPDIVLLDVNLPSMDGFEVLRGIRGIDSARDTVVLMLTALGDTSSIVKAFNMGADDYIIKPFSLVELSARVKSHYTLKTLQRQLVGMERLRTLQEVAVSFNHEINNPLMSISTFTYYLKSELSSGSDNIRHSIDGIMGEVDKISFIVKKLSAATTAASVDYGPGIKMIDFERLDEGSGGK